MYFSEGIQLTIGDCPLYFDEPCDSKVIRFTLNAIRINPYQPEKYSGFTSAPIKILIHGYGGLGIDYAIKNVSAAYRSVGYNTILGIIA